MNTTNISDIAYEMRENAGMIVMRGSVVYGTLTSRSDKDFLAIVPDKYEEFLSNYENGIFEYKFGDSDCQFISVSNFQKMIDDHTVLAMETLCTPDEYVCHFDLENCGFNLPIPFDRWKVRQQFSGTASNSWAKAHKKMTVEKDLDMYRGQKSLFHSLRILMFAIQLCERGVIYDFQAAKDLWYEIYDPFEKTTWEEYKAKYKPVYNELRSKLAILAPKPIEK